MLIVMIALIALALYIFAPQIAEAVPALDSPLASYVGWVDGLRISLDERVQGIAATGDETAEPADG